MLVSSTNNTCYQKNTFLETYFLKYFPRNTFLKFWYNNVSHVQVFASHYTEILLCQQQKMELFCKHKAHQPKT